MRTSKIIPHIEPSTIISVRFAMLFVVVPGNKVHTA